MADEAVIYTADHVLEYPFVRSVGPVVGAFLTGLRDGKVVGHPGQRGPGHRAADRVRPRDGGGDVGRGRGRARGHGHLVVLGGAAAAQAPAADALRLGAGAASTAPTPRSCTCCRRPSPDEVSTGMRVRPEFAPEDERVGHVKDISHFVAGRRWVVSEREPVTMMAATTHLDYVFTAGVARARTCTGTNRASSSGSAAPSARRSTSPHAGRARPTACPPTRSSSCPTRAR